MLKPILIILFYVFVTPMGWLLRVIGIDLLHHNKCEQNSNSVFIEKKHLYAADDLVSRW